MLFEACAGKAERGIDKKAAQVAGAKNPDPRQASHACASGDVRASLCRRVFLRDRQRRSVARHFGVVVAASLESGRMAYNLS